MRNKLILLNSTLTLTLTLTLILTLTSIYLYPFPPNNQDISVKEVSSFTYCCLKHTGPYSQIEAAIRNLMQNTQQQNIFPAGPLIGIYYNSPQETKPQQLEWEVGFPITPQAMVQAPLEKKQWTYRLVVSAIHVGSFETTPQTYTQMFEWMDAHQYSQTGPVLERYLHLSEPEAEISQAKTEIWIPCKKENPADN